MRASLVLAENFRNWGITHVFGIPGKSISPLMLDVDSTDIRFVLARHESGAGYEAGGYAMFGETLGIAIVTSGPGGTNALTSAAQANAFHVPVLFISGQPSASEIGKPLGQDSSQFGTDVVKMFEPVTRFSARVERPDVLRRYLEHAIEKAFAGARGPVHLCIPFDILMADINPFLTNLPIPTHVVSPDIDSVIPLLDQAKRAVLLLGKGVNSSRAYDEVQTVAEHWGIPVITTPGGKGVFPSHHPLALGNFGLGGSSAAADYIRSGTDLMVMVGTQASDMSLSGLTSDVYPNQVVYFNYDATFAGKTIPVPTKVILGDARLNLRRLIASANALRRDYAPVSVTTNQVRPHAESTSALSAVTAVRALRAALPPETILFGDDGSHTFYAIRHFDILEPGTFIFDDVFGAMGHPIGYAIGAKIALPDRPVVCLTGDGCTFMHGVEMSTATNEGVSVIFVVFNNGRLDMVDKGMSYNTGRTVGAIYNRPLDVCKFAESMGTNAIRCQSGDDIKLAIGTALQASGPTVLEVMVDPEEIPPILTRLLTLS